MTLRALVTMGFLLSASALNAREIPERGSYASPLGNFECSGYPLGARVDESLGPHGGTIRISDVREIRFDLEEFSPKLGPDMLRESRDTLYETYLLKNVMPMIRSARPKARILEAKAITLTAPPSLEGLRVFQSAVLLDEGLLRGQVQYTDGRFMFTMSTLNRGPLYGDEARQIRDIYEQLMYGLYGCRFPQ